jgi:hypothetical protein
MTLQSFIDVITVRWICFAVINAISAEWFAVMGNLFALIELEDFLKKKKRMPL